MELFLLLAGGIVIIGAINFLLMSFGGIFSEKLAEQCTEFHEKVVVNGFWIIFVIIVLLAAIVGTEL